MTFGLGIVAVGVMAGVGLVLMARWADRIVKDRLSWPWLLLVAVWLTVCGWWLGPLARATAAGWAAWVAEVLS